MFSNCFNVYFYVLGLPNEITSSLLASAAHLLDSIALVLNTNLDHPLRPFSESGYSAIGHYMKSSMYESKLIRLELIFNIKDLKSLILELKSIITKPDITKI